MARGDHILVTRYGGIYSHHGIDLGDGTVIHYNARHWYQPKQVIHTSLDDFAGGGELLVRDYQVFWQQLKRGSLIDKASLQFHQIMDLISGLRLADQDLSADAVVSRAESRLGETTFALMMNNCEHFATWCKIGVSDSVQVRRLWQMGRHLFRSKGVLKPYVKTEKLGISLSND